MKIDVKQEILKIIPTFKGEITQKKASEGSSGKTRFTFDIETKDEAELKKHKESIINMEPEAKLTLERNEKKTEENRKRGRSRSTDKSHGSNDDKDKKVRYCCG